MRLSDLPPGSRFQYPGSGKSAILLSVGACGARIVYDDSGRKVAFQSGEGDEVAFDAPGKPVLVSAGSDVVPLLDEPDGA